VELSIGSLAYRTHALVMTRRGLPGASSVPKRQGRLVKVALVVCGLFCLPPSEGETVNVALAIVGLCPRSSPRLHSVRHESR
jgi:hypothetical protein